MTGDFQADVMAGVAHQESRKNEPEHRIADAEVEGLRPQTVALRDIAGEQGGDTDGEITGEFIEPDREPSRFRSHEIDLHDDRHRPGEALIDAEQRIRRDNPAPARPPGNHERNRKADEPAENKHMLAAIDIGKMAGDQIGECLDDAEADDEGEDGRGRSDLEFFGADQRDHRACNPTMPPTKALMRTSSENCCQFSRKPSVMPAADRTGRIGSGAAHYAAANLPEFMARISAACGGGGGMSASMTRTNSSSSPIRNALLWRFSNPMVDVGLPLRLRPHTEPE